MEHSRIGDGLWVKGEATYRNDEMQIVGSLAACRRGDGPQTPLRNHDRGPHLTSLSLLVKCFELDQRMSPFIIFGNTLQYFPIPPNTSAKKFFLLILLFKKEIKTSRAGRRTATFSCFFSNARASSHPMIQVRRLRPSVCTNRHRGSQTSSDLSIFFSFLKIQ